MRARDVQIRTTPASSVAGRETLYFDIPGSDRSSSTLEVVFDRNYDVNESEFRLLKAAAWLAAAVLEFERPLVEVDDDARLARGPAPGRARRIADSRKPGSNELCWRSWSSSRVWRLRRLARSRASAPRCRRLALDTGARRRSSPDVSIASRATPQAPSRDVHHPRPPPRHLLQRRRRHDWPRRSSMQPVTSRRPRVHRLCATGRRGELTTNVCLRTREIEDAAADLAYVRALREGSAPPGRISGQVLVIPRDLAGKPNDRPVRRRPA